MASELYAAARDILNHAAEDLTSEAKRNLSRKEAENEMCAEDRAFMAERRAKVKL